VSGADCTRPLAERAPGQDLAAAAAVHQLMDAAGRTFHEVAFRGGGRIEGGPHLLILQARLVEREDDVLVDVAIGVLGGAGQARRDEAV
jgi:hypothetical protein